MNDAGPNQYDERMQLRNPGELMHPGSCCVCGSGNNEEGYLDIGVYYDYEGQVYLCMTCVEQAAVTVGLLNRGEAKHLQETNERLAEQHASLTSELEKANERLSHYDALLGGRFTSDRNPTDNVVEQPDESPDGELTDEPVSSGTEPEPVVTEPSEDDGRSFAERYASSNVGSGSGLSL